MIRQPAKESALLAQLSSPFEQPATSLRTNKVQKEALRTILERTTWVQRTVRDSTDDIPPRYQAATALSGLPLAKPLPPAQ